MLGFFMIQFGMTRPENMEKPKMKMFLEEFMSVYWQVETEEASHVRNNINSMYRSFSDVYFFLLHLPED